MTTPAERSRALRWGEHLLGRLAVDQALAGETRVRALAILKDYPTASTIKDWVDRGLPMPPREAAAAIEAASVFFYELPAHDGASAGYKSQLTDVQRHFPPPGSASSAARLGFFGGIKEWLAE